MKIEFRNKELLIKIFEKAHKIGLFRAPTFEFNLFLPIYDQLYNSETSVASRRCFNEDNNFVR